MSDFFSEVIKAPADPILGLTVSFLKDPRENKVNLSAGIYKTEDGKTPVLRCVKEAEKLILETEESKNYLPIEGDFIFLEEVGKLVLGNKLYEQLLPNLSSVQSLGGAGALRLGGELLKQESPNSSLFISNPTWPNHRAIFEQVGLSVHSYPYYDFERQKLDFEGLYSFLLALPAKSIVVLHANCHNPSGADLSKEDWGIIADLFIEKKLMPFFDAAYLGFDSSFEEDAYPIRLFASKGIEFLAAFSFSKNFSLYAERIGMFLSYSKGESSISILSQLKKLVRRNYSNPPLHGARVIGTILKSPSLKEMWEEELAQMRERIQSSRNLFVSKLERAGMQKEYSHFLDKKGLFCFCDLSSNQVDRIIKEYGIYMTSDGRINIAGLNASNIDQVVQALKEVGG